MPAPPCVFRDLSDEAYRIDHLTGKQTLTEVWLCSWPTTLGAVPPWVKRTINGGLAIRPEHDCPNCPVRRP
jgi:hypothetical protein